MSTITERGVKKIFLLKVTGLFPKGFVRDYRQKLWLVKELARHEKQWLSKYISNNVSEKDKQRKECKLGNTSKEKYLESNKNFSGLFIRANLK